jgi:hypothetical protein
MPSTRPVRLDTPGSGKELPRRARREGGASESRRQIRGNPQHEFARIPPPSPAIPANPRPGIPAIILATQARRDISRTTGEEASVRDVDDGTKNSIQSETAERSSLPIANAQINSAHYPGRI